MNFFAQAMQQKNLSLSKKMISDFKESKRPILGICLGMQLLFEESEEFGLTKGIGFFKGKVKNFNKFNVEKQTFIVTKGHIILLMPLLTHAFPV